jgi:hypothetical protein
MGKSTRGTGKEIRYKKDKGKQERKKLFFL